ncbi:hypothetical protein EVAR_44261_1 [Eumeta japonica]|uniref:Uncharacterized protein n=1 Tax=Eumeta variegata TaxID=151549 RepID=A0A4C1X8C5_EUMVA|nr:hypothetical protein EVAR_44261_1 [Eumeta japonica]
MPFFLYLVYFEQYRNLERDQNCNEKRGQDWDRKREPYGKKCPTDAFETETRARQKRESKRIQYNVQNWRSELPANDMMWREWDQDYNLVLPDRPKISLYRHRIILNVIILFRSMDAFTFLQLFSKCNNINDNYEVGDRWWRRGGGWRAHGAGVAARALCRTGDVALRCLRAARPLAHRIRLGPRRRSEASLTYLNVYKLVFAYLNVSYNYRETADISIRI